MKPSGQRLSEARRQQTSRGVQLMHGRNFARGSLMFSWRHAFSMNRSLPRCTARRVPTMEPRTVTPYE